MDCDGIAAPEIELWRTQWTLADTQHAVFKTMGGSSTEVRPRSSLSTIVDCMHRMTANDSQDRRRSGYSKRLSVQEPSQTPPESAALIDPDHSLGIQSVSTARLQELLSSPQMRK